MPDSLPCCMDYHNTVSSRYIVIVFLWRFHERRPIARPWGRDMGCHHEWHPIFLPHGELWGVIRECKVWLTYHCNCCSVCIGFRSRFSQCVDYMRFNEKSFCFRWQETTKLMLFFNTETSSLVVLCDLRYLTGNISSVMTKHMGVQRKLHRFAYLIVQIILGFYS